MHLLTTNFLSASIFFVLLATTYAALNGPCSANGTPGVCISTSACSNGGGTSQSGFCPNDPVNIKCCTKTSCGNGGNCRFTSACASGNTLAGKPGLDLYIFYANSLYFRTLPRTFRFQVLPTSLRLHSTCSQRG